MGAWRLRACLEDEEDDENDYQRIVIEPIFDADSCVFFDLDAKRQDKADARFCFVLSSMTVDAFKDEYDEDPTTWDKSINNTEFDWCSGDVVYVPNGNWHGSDEFKIMVITTTTRFNDSKNPYIEVPGRIVQSPPNNFEDKKVKTSGGSSGVLTLLGLVGLLGLRRFRK